MSGKRIVLVKRSRLYRDRPWPKLAFLYNFTYNLRQKKINCNGSKPKNTQNQIRSQKIFGLLIRLPSFPFLVDIPVLFLITPSSFILLPWMNLVFLCSIKVESLILLDSLPNLNSDFRRVGGVDCLRDQSV